MNTISIVYFSGSGSTTKLANAVAAGAAAVAGTRTNLIALAGADIKEGRYENEAVLAQLDTSDAIRITSRYRTSPKRHSRKAFPTVHQRVLFLGIESLGL